MSTLSAVVKPALQTPFCVLLGAVEHQYVAFSSAIHESWKSLLKKNGNEQVDTLSSSPLGFVKTTVQVSYNDYMQNNQKQLKNG